jgi:hypothetical protein
VVPLRPTGPTPVAPSNVVPLRPGLTPVASPTPNVTPQDVAYLARTSVDVIYKHYVGRNRKIEIPEF